MGIAIGKSLREWAADWVAAHGPFRNQAEEIVRNTMARPDCQAIAERWAFPATQLTPPQEAMVKRVLALEAIEFARRGAHVPYWVEEFGKVATRLRKTPIEFGLPETIHPKVSEVTPL